MKLKEIEERLDKINLKLIYKKDYNTKEKVDVIDRNGYKYYISLGNMLQRGSQDNYCKNNNIKLIKIPYWDIKNDKYKEIINTLIHNI